MGTPTWISFTLGAITAYDKNATPGSTVNFNFENNTVRYTGSALILKNINGTVENPVKIANNMFYENVAITASAAHVSVLASNNSNIEISGNTVKSFGFFLNFSGPNYTTTNLLISNNKAVSNYFWYSPGGGSIKYPDLRVTGNILHGFGATWDSAATTFMKTIIGTSGHPALIYDNEFAHNYRTIQHEGFVSIYNNRFINSYKHSNMMGGSPTANGLYIQDVNFFNNVAWGRGEANAMSGQFQLGYANRIWLDGCYAKNNTFYGARNGIDLADLDIGSTGLSSNITLLATKLEVDNNMVSGQAVYGIQVGNNGFNNQYNRSRLHMVSLDNNVVYSSGTANYKTVTPGRFTWGGERYNLAASRNITGVALHTASYSGSQTGKSLVYTANTPGSDETLAWDGGTAVQLVAYTGALTADATSPTDASTSTVVTSLATDGTKTFQTNDYREADINANLNPSSNWIKITSGAGAGQIRAVVYNTATVLTVVPPFTTLPVTGDTYTIYKSMVQLTDGAGTNTVMAGIDLRTLPPTSQTDTGISWANNSLTSNPLLVSPASLSMTVNDFKITAGSPAIDAGTTLNAPAADYFGNLRTTADVGFHEYLVAVSQTTTPRRIKALGIGLGLGF